MKFTKGYWMNLPGVTNTDAVQVREVKVENDRVYLYTVPYHADMRAMGGLWARLPWLPAETPSCRPN